MDKPLAAILSPTTITNIIGQTHLLNDKNGIINRILHQKFLTSLIFYGNPGVGKTTIAQALANDLKCKFGIFNAAIDKKEDLEKLIKIAHNTKPYIIIIEEIQRMNRDRQDLLLQYLEHGDFILMACTTENPYFIINPALRSRCLLLELKPITNEEMFIGLKKIIANNSFLNFKLTDEILEIICNLATGDLRVAINILEILIKLYPNKIITIDIIKAIMPNASSWNVKEGNEHHDLKSALQKSIRGSDVNAALHYLVRLLASGDYEGLLRRMLIIAYEDIGLANPALGIRVKGAVDVFRQIGMPEGLIPLGLVVIEMALSEKSNSVNLAVQKAYSDVLQGKIYPIPDYLKHNWSKTLKKSVGKGKLYKFPHDYDNDYVQQQYLPTKLKDIKYYQPKLHTIYEKRINEIYNKFTKK